MNGFRGSLFRTLKTLKRGVEVTLRRYVHTLDYGDLDLSLFSSPKSREAMPAPLFTALRVMLVHEVMYISEKHRVRPSSEVAALLKQHRDISTLCLELPGTSSMGYIHDDHSYESKHALENIDPTGLPIKSLSLHGEFYMSDTAWSHWGSMPWSQLETLSLCTDTTVSELGSRLEKQSLPSLRTLLLCAYVNQFTPLVEEPATWELPFIQGLEELSVVGYHPETAVKYLHRDPRNATSLRRLRFHAREPRNQILASHIEQLSICPRLVWLGLDLQVTDFPKAEDDKPDRSLEFIDALAKLRPLQELHVLLRGKKTDATPIDGRDILTLFQRINSLKQGCPLESLVVCWYQWTRTQAVWIVSGWGEGRALMDCRSYGTPRRIEAWDLESMSVVEEYKAGWDHTWERSWLDESEDLFWGLPDR